MRCFGLTVPGAAALTLLAAVNVRGQDVYSQWPTDKLADLNFFPIGVWYQTPDPSWNNEINGYKTLGINTFVYLDPGTSTTVLNDIANAGMYTLMQYSPSLVNNKMVLAWYSSPDEPDNAQNGTEYPNSPQTQINGYNTIKAENSSLPVYEGFGRGVAVNTWVGRGVRYNHPEDYPAVTNGTWWDGTHFTQGYLASTDIGGFDVYPANAYNGQTNLVAQGVSNLVKWSKPGNPVWNTIETTQIDTSSGAAPTPAQVHAEVWLSLVNGSHGIVYFADQVGTTFNEQALLTMSQYAAMRTEITNIDNQIESLAPVLNGPTVNHGITATGSTVNVEFMTKVLDNKEYIFTATDQSGGNGTVLFDDPTLAGLSTTMYELLDNGGIQPLNMVNGQFSASFTPNDVHLYEIPLLVPEPATMSLLAVGSLMLLRRRHTPRR